MARCWDPGFAKKMRSGEIPTGIAPVTPPLRAVIHTRSRSRSDAPEGTPGRNTIAARRTPRWGGTVTHFGVTATKVLGSDRPRSNMDQTPPPAIVSDLRGETQFRARIPNFFLEPDLCRYMHVQNGKFEIGFPLV